MDNLGGSYRFWGFWRRIQEKVSLLGGSAKTRLRLMGMAFGGVLSLLGLFVRFLHITAFLLFVPNTRVLAIAHIDIILEDGRAAINDLGLSGNSRLESLMASWR